MSNTKERPQTPAAVFNQLVLFDPKQIHASSYLKQDHKVSGSNIEGQYIEGEGNGLLSISENSNDCGRSSEPEWPIRVIVVEPWSPPAIKMISNTLQAKQAIVGGFIEVVYPFTEQVAVILNEEGKLIGLPLNRKLGDDIIAGTFIICGLDEQNACFASLSDEQIKYYTNFFRTIEIYLGPANLNLTF